MIQLGDRVRDTITGFEGIATGEHKWLHGCRRFTITPTTLHDGKPIEAQTFDEPQLEVVKAKLHKGTSHTGGPRAEVRRPHVPTR